MNDAPAGNTPPTGPAQLDVRPVKQKIWRRLSLVWLVPIIALTVSLWAAWQSYADRGTLIEISFENASGVTAGETVIKYRDVEIGQVESVAFADGLGDVLVQARIDKTVAPYLDDDAEFWVVRPDVTVRGITGLDTVLSGVYIEGNWDTDADVPQLTFTGMEQPSLTRAGQRGSIVTLRTIDGSTVSAGAPVLHKGVQVGYLEKPELSFDGSEVLVNAFIESPFDRRLTTSTRFWDTSGFSVSFGTSGVALDVNSIASLIEGGIAFDTLVSGGEPISDTQTYDIFYDEQTARDSVFSDPNATLLNLAVLFDESVSGLTTGSEVRFQGIRIGEVKELNAIIVGEGDTAEVQLQSVLEIEPARLGMGGDANSEDALILLSDLVERGLRARLVTGNLLSGTLIVELLQVEDPLPKILNLTSGAYPVIPSTDAEIADVAATAEGVLARINSLPVEDVMNGAINLMDSLERLANDASTRAAPASIVALLDEARGLVASDDIQAIPGDLRQVINDLDGIVSSAADADLVGGIGSAITVMTAAISNIEAATQNLPDITAEIESLTAKANALELDALVASANDTLQSIDALLTAQGTLDLPSTLNGTLDELRLSLLAINEGSAIDNLNTALSSASQAALAVEDAVSGLPALSEQASSLVQQTEALMQSYGERSRFNAETIATLRDIQAAADAMSSLARTIQRNPNAFITGR